MPYPILRIPFGIPSIAFLAASPHHASQAHIKPKKGKEKEGKRKKKKKGRQRSGSHPRKVKKLSVNSFLPTQRASHPTISAARRASKASLPAHTHRCPFPWSFTLPLLRAASPCPRPRAPAIGLESCKPGTTTAAWVSFFFVVACTSLMQCGCETSKKRGAPGFGLAEKAIFAWVFYLGPPLLLPPFLANESRVWITEEGL